MSHNWHLCLALFNSLIVSSLLSSLVWTLPSTCSTFSATKDNCKSCPCLYRTISTIKFTGQIYLYFLWFNIFTDQIYYFFFNKLVKSNHEFMNLVYTNFFHQFLLWFFLTPQNWEGKFLIGPKNRLFLVKTRFVDS